MAVIVGLDASFGHNQNGMAKADMCAALLVAEQSHEVIIFRSTGPWAKRWLEKRYPSKNFHVKGKSSDWGPHAGLVSYDGIYSKVGYSKEKAAEGTKYNDDGLKSGFASKEPLVLTRDQINEQLTRPEGRPPRTALQSVLPVTDSPDLILTARRSGDQAVVAFRAVKLLDGGYEIRIYPGFGSVSANPMRLLDEEKKGKVKPVPFEVMTSNEVGGEKPMTGDYDLFCVCPSWDSYGGRALRTIEKPGIELRGEDKVRPGLKFEANGRQGVSVGLDRTLDPRLSTMGTGRSDGHLRSQVEIAKLKKEGKDVAQQAPRQLHMADFKDRQAQYQQSGRTLSKESQELAKDTSRYAEHEDMGNVTPRILRCINALNTAMGAVGDKAALRRVHHNAESHRFRAFGALSAKDMDTKKDGEEYGDGFPLTVFQPSNLAGGKEDTASYGDVCTLESLSEFRNYAIALTKAGYFVPKNWIWNVPSNVELLKAEFGSKIEAALALGRKGRSESRK